MLDTTSAVQNVADDYVKDRIDTDMGRDCTSDLIYEAISHACMVLGVALDEDAIDAIAEELTDRYTTTTDDTRSNGPRQ
jgi:hypothetical protein